ncbi:hypothetical protein Trydic_g19750 [Trypoxylus dichotomus]
MWGVPHGLVLEPTLWNIYYSEILEIPIPSGLHLIAYADDLGVVVTGKNVETLVEQTLSSVVNCLKDKSSNLPHRKQRQSSW